MHICCAVEFNWQPMYYFYCTQSIWVHQSTSSSLFRRSNFACSVVLSVPRICRLPHVDLATVSLSNAIAKPPVCCIHCPSIFCCGSVVLFSVSPSSLLMAPYSCPASVVDELVLASMPQFFVVYLSPIQSPPRADPLRSACSLFEHDVGLNGWV